MVKAPGHVESDSHKTLVHKTSTLEGGPGVEQGPFPETGEYGIVAESKPVRVKSAKSAGTHLFQHLHIVRGMKPKNFGFPSRFGLYEWGVRQIKEAVSLAKIISQAQAFDLQGMP